MFGRLVERAKLLVVHLDQQFEWGNTLQNLNSMLRRVVEYAAFLDWLTLRATNLAVIHVWRIWSQHLSGAAPPGNCSVKALALAMIDLGNMSFRRTLWFW